MLNRAEIPLKSDGMIAACDRDLDLWGNGERRLYHYLTPSLVDFLLKNTTIFSHPVNWCDVGCGAGWFLEGLVASCEARGVTIIPMGVDIVPRCIERCSSVWPHGRFSVCDLNLYKGGELMPDAPWTVADVVDFVEVFQMLKDYRKTVHEIWPEIKPGAVVVVADGIGYPYLRDYLKRMPGCTFLGGWVDHTMPVTPRDPNNPSSKNTHLKYRVYRKDPE